MPSKDHGSQTFGSRACPAQAKPPCVILQSCDPWSHDQIIVDAKRLNKCIDSLDVSVNAIQGPFYMNFLESGMSSSKPSHHVWTFRYWDLLNHEQNFLDPIRSKKCIDTIESTLKLLFMPSKDLPPGTFWNRACPSPSQASMCGTIVL